MFDVPTCVRASICVCVGGIQPPLRVTCTIRVHVGVQRLSTCQMAACSVMVLGRPAGMHGVAEGIGFLPSLVSTIKPSRRKQLSHISRQRVVRGVQLLHCDVGAE